jgi:hypothetical protein
MRVYAALRVEFPLQAQNEEDLKSIMKEMDRL